ncbi:hypothetical protein QFZ77_004663 [Paenibacillus sp. V4I3]|uniref:hypothetical protein n=1 Tax=Paenibacillus sp. V4I3 TaxID=3042305 RepID=UPI00278B944B|nr:hypothetical protein [Paenibacillus sp. V4I3]MDQ0876004.1 hypothetical protein [Paenibacillus sp. V4I3]
MKQTIHLKYDSNLEDIATELQGILGTGYQGAWDLSPVFVSVRSAQLSGRIHK